MQKRAFRLRRYTGELVQSQSPYQEPGIGKNKVFHLNFLYFSFDKIRITDLFPLHLKTILPCLLIGGNISTFSFEYSCVHKGTCTFLLRRKAALVTKTELKMPHPLQTAGAEGHVEARLLLCVCEGLGVQGVDLVVIWSFI